MRIVSWNIRGLGTEVKVSSIRKVITNVKAIFFIFYKKIGIGSKGFSKKKLV